MLPSGCTVQIYYVYLVWMSDLISYIKLTTTKVTKIIIYDERVDVVRLVL